MQSILQKKEKGQDDIIMSRKKLKPTRPEIKISFEWALDYLSYNDLLDLADEMKKERKISKPQYLEILDIIAIKKEAEDE